MAIEVIDMKYFCDTIKVNVYGTIEQPLFKAKEIATILEYANTEQAIRVNVEEDDIKTYPLRDSGQLRHCKFITEEGLYDLAMSSKMPKAREFKKWVTHEVIPALRKTGKYEMPKQSQALVPQDQTTLDMCKFLLEVSPTERDKLFVADVLRNKLGITAPAIEGNEEWSCSRRLSEHFHINSRAQHAQLASFGKSMRQAYFNKHNKAPPQRQEYVNGTVRQVNHYVLSDWLDFGDDLMRTFFNL